MGGAHCVHSWLLSTSMWSCKYFPKQLFSHDCSKFASFRIAFQQTLFFFVFFLHNGFPSLIAWRIISFVLWPAASPCPRGWLKDGGMCYGFFGSISSPAVSMYLPLVIPLTWPEARQSCMSIGADLVSIHNNNTQWLLAQAVDDMSVGWMTFWTGLNQLGAQRGSYAWADGSPLDFTYWARKQPNDYGGRQDCVEVRISDRRVGYHYRWDDRNCLNRRAFVCSIQTGGCLAKNTSVCC